MLVAVFAGVTKMLAVKEIEAHEIYISAGLMAIALPMQALSATYRGVNEAYLNFRSISVVRVALGVANFGLPLVAAVFSQKVYWLVAGIVFSRGIALYVYKYLADHCISEVRTFRPEFSLEIARGLARFGGWFTVSSVLNPIISIADRFIIASTISAAAVAIYVVPYEMVVQSLTIVGAITTVAFPYLSKIRVSEPLRAAKVFRKALLWTLALMACVSVAYFILGWRVLEVWLGSEYSSQYSNVIKILSIGLVSYTLGTMCIAWLHAHGKTHTTAKLNLLEFPLYLALVYFAIKIFGIEGAAVAWVARVTLNALVLYYFASKLNEK